MATETTTIRVTKTTRDRLSSIARARGKTTGDLLAEVAAELDDDALLESAERSWHSMSDQELAGYGREAADLGQFTAPLDAE